MRKYYLYIGASLLILSLLMSCGGGGGGSSSGSNTSLVTITVGNSVTAATLKIENNTFFARTKIFLKDLLRPDTAIAAIPSNVYKIAFTISASDITTITREVILSGQTTVTETFSVPNGNDRYFLLEAMDSSGTVQYKGSTYADLTGTPVTLDIAMTATDTVAPYVISTSPASNETRVSVTTPITVTFSESIDSSTCNSSTFMLKTGTTDVAGTISVNGSIVTFTPSTNLKYNTSYTATITTGVKDLNGNAMSLNYSWSFSTMSIEGKWGYVYLEHLNDGTWGSTAGTLVFNSDGRGTDTYKSNYGGVLTSKTETFTYTITENSNGTFTLTQTYADGTDKVEVVLSDDGNMAIVDGTSDSSGQFMAVIVRMDSSKTYSNADLSGDYYLMNYYYNTNYGICPSALSGVVTSDGNGAVSAVYTENACGTISSGSGTGTYSVSSDGSSTADDRDIGYISGNGKLSVSSKVTTLGAYDIGFAMKKGDKTYSTADLAGTWAIVGFGDSSGTSFNADFGTLNCDSNGNCTYSYKNQKDGNATYSSFSFTVSISSDGTIGTYSGIPVFAAGNNGNTVILNDSFDAADTSKRNIYIGVRCSDCSNLGRFKRKSR
jgi:hypothetical protein